MNINGVEISPEKLPPMTQKRRELCMRACAGEQAAIFILCFLHCSDFRRLNDFLQWLITNRYTGKNLVEWFNGHREIKGSPLLLSAYVTKYLEKTKEMRPLFYKKDFLWRELLSFS